MGAKQARRPNLYLAARVCAPVNEASGRQAWPGVSLAARRAGPRANALNSIDSPPYSGNSWRMAVATSRPRVLSGRATSILQGVAVQERDGPDNGRGAVVHLVDNDSVRHPFQRPTGEEFRAVPRPFLIRYECSRETARRLAPDSSSANRIFTM